MTESRIYTDEVRVSLKTGPDIVDITGDLERLVKVSGVGKGLLAANMVGSTGSLTTIEYEPGVVADLKRAIERMAPRAMESEHEKAWHDGNGHSHVQAALMGPSLFIAIRGGTLALGTWQQAVAVNHDKRARKRTVAVTIMGC